MLPTIVHSRSRLASYTHDFEDGARVFGVSCDTYPDLFEVAYPAIVGKAPNGWRSNPAGKYRYLWFPPGALDEIELNAIEGWAEQFRQYVLIGLNQYIKGHFSDELDFCLALDYTYDPTIRRRTLYGEAIYQLKYQHSRQHLKTLQAGLVDAFNVLPLPPREKIVITHVPFPANKRDVPRGLAAAVALALSHEYVDAHLLCRKSAMKGRPVAEKIPEWETILGRQDCVQLQGDVRGRTVVVIDDLYQSGATIWCYAKYLKRCGAKYVLGMPCVKALKDTDNR